tara:strand:+ start:375 stop:695 length:321 start_codon:yes stop_codon:yes gene_type:complete
MRKLFGDSLPTQKEIEANKLANAKRREEEATPPTPSDEGSDASTCSAIEFSHDDFSTVRFEKESGSDIIIIHDPHNAWKDWYSLTETQAHDLKCWLERNFQQNDQV